MRTPAYPLNEAERITALERYGILDTPPDAVLDGIAQAAADLCETPMVLITLIDPDRQWFKSCIGMPVRETSRDIAFCAHAILEPGKLMEVEDASLDERFADNPLVTGEPMIRFYAGKPLVTIDGHALGTLCVIDDKPRRLSAAQRSGLERLAQVVIDLIDERVSSRPSAIDQAVEQVAGHAVLITDPTQPDNPVTYVNPAAEAMTGYSKAEMLGRNCRFLQGPDTDPKTIATLREAIAEQRHCTVTLKNYRKDGGDFWNELTISPVKDKRGDTVQFVGIQKDVSDRYLAEERAHQLESETRARTQAQASANRLARIVEESADEIYIADAETFQLLDANRAAHKNLGYTLEQMCELMPWDFVEGLDQQKVEALVAPLRTESLVAQSIETTHLRKDGSTYPVAARLQFMSALTPPVFTVIVQDITERKRLDASVRLRDRAIEAVDVGVSITDARVPGHPLVYVNRTLCTMTGYRADELLGQSLRVLQKGERHQPEHLKIEEAQAKGEPVQVVFRSTRKDGSQYMDELSLSPVHNKAGELTHYIGVKRDITERLETEARLHQAEKIKAVGELSGGVAHDFNNLLSVITGNLEFLAMEIEDETLRDYIKEADNAAQMGARLTHRLLTFARQRRFEPAVVNINDTVLSAIQLLQSTIGESIALSYTLLPELWNTRVDPSEIENTVVNLAINARDAMPSGGRIEIATVNVTFDPSDLDDALDLAPGDYVRLSVSDNGSGMSEDVKARAFEPFYTTKEPGKGTGLGLASIHGFAKQSGGHVNVYSELGQGTVISVYLPKHRAKAKAEEAPDSRLAHGRWRGDERRVLVVEDDERVRRVTVKRLHALGFQTVEAADGHSALRVLEQDTGIDLVLSDIVMGAGMSGLDVARWVRANRPDSRILLTSGFSEQMVAMDADEMEDLLVLQKPYDLAKLQAAVAGAFGEEPMKA